MNRPLRILLIGWTAMMLVLLSGACKKLDFTRYPAVNTATATNVSGVSATGNGEIIDLGDGNMTDHGFCWATHQNPTTGGPSKSLGIAVTLGPFSAMMTGLQGNTNYYYRAYVKTDNEIFYGELKTFKTQFTTGSTWLHYDDGVNFDGIGKTGGGSWDYAIRFPASDLSGFDGLRIESIKFYPWGSSQADFSVTVWTGNVPDLDHIQSVTNPLFEQFNTVFLSTNLYVDASKDLWIGIWVQDQLDGEYPGGVDAGPAVSGLGDLISFDDGVTWESLYVLNNSLNYNWNLQVYVTNTKGEVVQLERTAEIVKTNHQTEQMTQEKRSVTSSKMANNGEVKQ